MLCISYTRAVQKIPASPSFEICYTPLTFTLASPAQKLRLKSELVFQVI